MSRDVHIRLHESEEEDLADIAGSIDVSAYLSRALCVLLRAAQVDSQAGSGHSDQGAQPDQDGESDEDPPDQANQFEQTAQ